MTARNLRSPRGGTGIGRAVSRHRKTAAVVLVAAAVVVAAGMYWFEPWKLFVDETVEEALPSGGAAEASEGAGGADGEPAVLSTGAFRSLEHETTGEARILQLPDGSRFVRLEELNTSNGPDLVVLLSDTPATEDDWGAYDDGGTVLLGELKANIGSQNYEIPRDVDLSKYRSVVVWCRRFTVGFGAAPIE